MQEDLLWLRLQEFSSLLWSGSCDHRGPLAPPPPPPLLSSCLQIDPSFTRCSILLINDFIQASSRGVESPFKVTKKICRHCTFPEVRRSADVRQEENELHQLPSWGGEPFAFIYLFSFCCCCCRSFKVGYIGLDKHLKACSILYNSCTTLVKKWFTPSA